MKDLLARAEIYSLKMSRESHYEMIKEKAYTNQVEHLQDEVAALTKAFNDLMELVVAKDHLVNLNQFSGPHTLDVQRSAVEMMGT